jgi:signal transduction histidine kinase
MQPNDDRGDHASLPPEVEEGDTAPSGAPETHTGLRRLNLRNWRVRWRLVALILVPTLVAVVLGGLRISTAVANERAYARLEYLAKLGRGVASLAHEVGTERDLTVGYIADGRRHGDLATVREQYSRVDSAASSVKSMESKIDASYGPTVVESVTKMKSRLDALSYLRGNATKTQMPAASVLQVYSEAIEDLLSFNDMLTQGAADSRLAQTARAMAAVSRAEEQASTQRGLLYASIIRGSLTNSDLAATAAARSGENSAINTFRDVATTDQRQAYDDTVIGSQVDQYEEFRERAISLGLTGQASRHLDLDPTSSFDADEWLKAATAKIDLMNGVALRLANDVIVGSSARKSDATQSAIINAAAVVLVILLVLIVTLIMAQSLVRPLRRLRTGALEVAGTRLPDFVRRLREPDVEQVGFDVEPIDVDSTDEIGEVARAFDEVHREAVRLASNEAMLRGNVNAMFVNLSRRSQSLIERQLRLIEDLEQSEQDSGRLDSLFKLDHLATRMRRNCENLLVLGGQEQARRWTKPVPLVDIVRASLSEVEQYERITLRIQDEVSVNGRVVNDLVHLVAELVENATTFSPEHTKVAVSGHLLSGGGAMLQISDSGVGMSPEELEEANWRLANPPTIDVSVSRRMGLFVVGRLAQRHGIRVELRAALSGGLTAFVILAPNTIMQDTGKVRPQRLESLPGSPMDRAGAQRVQPGPAGQSSRPLRPPMVRGEIARPEENDRPPVPDTPREPLRSHGGSPLPKRKAAPTSPPGRGPGSTAPSRSSRPQGVPPSRPAPPPGPPVEPPPPRPVPQAQPQPAGPAFGESRVAENNGRSPIFEAMQSEWFQRRKTGSMSRAESSPPREWSSPGDEGWRAAETVREPATGGQTSAGLPKRVPGSNRIPGSVGAAARPAAPPVQPAQPAPAAPRPESRPPEAEAVRNRFASFQQGVRKGRAAIRPEDDERENQ